MAELDAINDIHFRMQALDYVDALAKQHLDGKDEDSFDGQLATTRIEALLSLWLQDHQGAQDALVKAPVKRRKKQTATKQ